MSLCLLPHSYAICIPNPGDLEVQADGRRTHPVYANQRNALEQQLYPSQFAECSAHFLGMCRARN